VSRDEETPGMAEAVRRHPELPGNAVSRALPRPFALLSQDATNSGDVTARYRRPASAGYGLFPGGVGNTQKDPGHVLPDSTWVYPGHGKDTTLGAERPHLAEWRERGW